MWFKFAGKIFLACCAIAVILKTVAASETNEEGDLSIVSVDGDGLEEPVQFDSQPAGHLLPLGEHAEPTSPDGVVAELDYMISGQDFYEHFVRKRKPVVFRGGAKDWPATKHWHNEDYLREHYNDTLFDVELAKTHHTELNVRQTMTMGEFLNRYEKETIYLDSPFPQSKMIRDLRMPYCMQCEELHKTVESAHLLFSSGNTSSSFHHDGYENLLVMVSGIKTVLLINHTYTEEVYGNNATVFPGVSPVNPEGVDLFMFPKLASVPFYKITLRPGDILYNPQFWWHQVRSHQSPNIGVSIWFLAFQNYSDITENENFESRNVVRSEEEFAEVVSKSPKTIECHKQNLNIRTASYFRSSASDLISVENVTLLTMNTGQKMPIVGFGTAGLLSKTAESVLIALDEGYRLIDSAQGYNESGVGLALKKTNVPREDIFIVSKIHPKHLGYEPTLTSVDQSLVDLGVKFIDLMLIHSKDCDEGPDALLPCDPGGPQGTWRDTWRALEKANDDGKVLSIGVSNFEIEDLTELMQFATRPPAAVQNAFDPFLHDEAVRSWCRENDVVYMSASTLGAAWERDGMTPNPVLTDSGLRDIAINNDIDVARVVLRWAIDQDVVVLPRSANPDHIATNFRLSNVALSPSDKTYIEGLPATMDFEALRRIPIEAVTMTTTSELTSPMDHVTHEVVADGQAIIYISSDDFYIYAFDATTGRRMWEVRTADETGSTCAFNADGSVTYCGADDGLLRALDTRTGAILWAATANKPITSSPCVGSDGKVFVGSHNTNFYAINANGSLVWRRNLTGSIWSSPIIEDGIVYIGAKAYDIVNFFALDEASGKIVWSYEAFDGFMSSPRISYDKAVVYACDTSGHFYAFNAKNGSLLWRTELHGSCESSPAVAKNGVLFIATVLGRMCALDGKGGTIIWTTEVARDTNSSPCLGKDNVVYIGAGNGTVSALQRSDGQVIWSTNIGSSIFFSSPRLANNGLLYIGSVDGPLHALDAASGEKKWTASTNGPIVGTPLITRRHAVFYD